MAYIIKITRELDKWKLEDWKHRWVEYATDAHINRHNPHSSFGGITYFLNKAIANGEDNYFHADWEDDGWRILGRCINPKRKW